MIRRTLALAAFASCLASAQTSSDIDLYLLTRALRGEIVAARASEQKRPEVFKRAVSAFRSRNPETARIDRLRALAELRQVPWTAAHDAAAAYRLVPGETLVEPGESVHAAIELWQPGATEPPDGLAASVTIRDQRGQTVSEARKRDILELVGSEVSLRAPREEGCYALVLELKDAKTGTLAAQARATVWVVHNLRSRLSAIGTRAASVALRSQTPAHPAWGSTLLAIVECYSGGSGHPLRKASQFTSPITQTLAPVEEIEPLDPIGDLAWAERTLGALEKGEDPANGLEGWIPFAVRSHSDHTLRLARVCWPREKPVGLVLLLGDLLSHSRSWSGLRAGPGFFALAPLTRAGEAGWAGKTWEDVEDWMAALAAVAGLQQHRLFILAHGNGAGDALSQLSKTPTRFTAAAVVAGTSEKPLPGLPKDFPPLMLVEAGKDVFVPADELRRAGIAFQRRLPAFEYLVMTGETHAGVRDAFLPRAIDFFASVAAGTWKPSGKPVPLPASTTQ